MQGFPRSIKTSLQKSFSCAISKYIGGNIAQEHSLYNVNPEHTDMVLQENNLHNIVLNLPERTLYKACGKYNITCAM